MLGPRGMSLQRPISTATARPTFFKNKSEGKTANRLLSLMSTMEGKHGKVYSQTEVPRAKLVRELRGQSDLFTTQQLKAKDFFHDTVVKF
jgi:hypothetical protein